MLLNIMRARGSNPKWPPWCAFAGVMFSSGIKKSGAVRTEAQTDSMPLRRVPASRFLKERKNEKHFIFC